MKICLYRILVLIVGILIMVIASLADYLSQKQFCELLELVRIIILKSFFHWG